MKERPILFSAPMVRAILDGRKTMTRRILKPQPPPECGIHYMLGDESWMPEDKRTSLCHHWEAWGGPLFENRPPKHLCGSHTVKCPFGKSGDRLWVRETHLIVGGKDCSNPRVVYRATNDGDDAWVSATWRPSIFMPRWASRITLEITGVSVERLQEISEDDAKAEGAADTFSREKCPGFIDDMRYTATFSSLWESINGPGSWAANPWVWVVSFRRIR